MSSREDSTNPSAPFSSIDLRILAHLSARDSPAHFTSSSITGSQESAGRSESVWRVAPFFARSSVSSSASSALTVLPSKPRHIPSPNFSSRNWCTVGTSGSPILKSSTPVPSSCAAAWMKYLPSVHNPAISCMMTALPADPVKPVIYFLHLKYSPTYSDAWKSSVGTR